MLAFLQQPEVIRWFSLGGSLAAVAGSLVAALSYCGRQQERYSLFNHFISELGERGVSRRAWAFNLGLILCGLFLLPASIGLGLYLPGIWARLGMVAGVVASVSVSLVGVFPMDNIKPHIRAAMAYFRSGLVMILLFSVAILFPPQEQAVLPPVVGWLGLPAVASYAFFLIYSTITFKRADDALGASMENRPRFWPLTFVEWLIFLTTIPWFFAVALTL